MALDAQRGLLYFIADDVICCVDGDGHLRALARIPPRQTTAFILSATAAAGCAFRPPMTAQWSNRSLLG